VQIPLSEANVPQGAYGLRIEGLSTSALVFPVPKSWPPLRLERRPLGTDAPEHTKIGADVVELAFESGWSLRIERPSRTATFFLPSPVSDDELVHPYLAPAAMHFAGWLDREAFHGGAFIGDGVAFAVLAQRGGGKSTTLAHLVRRDVPVLVDDALVVEAGAALAGPRCIDLRPTAASRLGGPLVKVRRGDRRRLELPPTAPSFPLGGFFVLEWASRLAIEPLAPAERLAVLARHCRPEIARRPSLLELARLPGWRVERPADPASLDDVCGQLLEAALG
jgi:hypothetical protein